jgi:isoquinoline 1-oxidoreductase beta subunit
MPTIVKIDRRDFLKLSSGAAGGLVLGFHLPLPAGADGAAEFKPNVFIAVQTDGSVLFTTPRPEMGQGSRTGFKMIVADELEFPWEKIRIEMALAGPREVWGSMTAGGSTSIRQFFGPLGEAAATARQMLMTAGAQRWGVGERECRAREGKVEHIPSGRTFSYGELAEAAAALPLPERVVRKASHEYRFIGSERRRVDIPEKVDGSAVFGLDFRLPGMKFAVVKRPPTFGGSPRGFDPVETMKVRGVEQVVTISAGVAVVASSTWPALKGMDRLRIDWDPGPNTGVSSETIARQLEADGRSEPMVAEEVRGGREVFARAARTLKAVYENPFISHSPLELINCTAWVQGDEADVWVPTQAPQTSWTAAANALGFPLEKVRVHTLYTGGAFGRRLTAEWCADAVEVSRAVGGPVQILWTRQEDTTHDNYRPISRHQMEAAFDASGQWIGWRHRVIAHSTSGAANPERMATRVDSGALDGAWRLAYNWPSALIEWKMSNTPLTTGAFRSVYAQQNCFATEAFLDEVAAELKKDPLALRLELLEGSDARLAAVLKKAAEGIGWGRTLPRGRGLGIACTYCFGGRVAHALEVEVLPDGRVKVHQVHSAVDCGLAVYPDGVRQQIEGGVVMALTAALKAQITVKGGQVEQQTFADYPLLTIDETPEVTVHIVNGGDPVGGVGEPPVPPLAPALVNAIFAATGKRLRKLPIGRVPV